MMGQWLSGRKILARTFRRGVPSVFEEVFTVLSFHFSRVPIQLQVLNSVTLYVGKYFVTVSDATGQLWF